MNRRRQRILRYLAAVAAIALALWVYAPERRETQLAAVCRVNIHPYYALPVIGGDTLYLSASDDRNRPPAALVPDSLGGAAVHSGTFVSGEGHFLTVSPLSSETPERLVGDTLRRRLKTVKAALLLQRSAVRDRLTALNRYSRNHSTIDDGYNEVMYYRTSEQLADSLLSRALSLLEKVGGGEARLVYRLSVTTASDTTRRAAEAVRTDRGVLLARIRDGHLPYGAGRMSVYRLGARAFRSRIIAFNDLGKTHYAPRPERLERHATLLATAEGGTYVNRSGNLCGLLYQGQRVSSVRLAELMAKEHTWPGWWWLNLKANFERRRANSEKDKPAPQAVNRKKKQAAPMRITGRRTFTSGTYEGEMTADSLRCGYGRLIVKESVRYEGLWRADTLVCGFRESSAERYSGSFNRRLEPTGFGIFFNREGERYSGEWANGKRNGLGFAVNGESLVRCGTWRNDRFKGEHMVYTPDRVYGIDLSRHQHEKGRHRYSIDWNRLKITGLGSGRRVSGTVDYPVSFAYIKATEGTTVYNRYYAADIQQARRHGIAVGSYHFFSTLTPGAAQANHFLSKASIGRNDLPPVLDVEPSDYQIQQLGGEARLFKEIENWLRIVERKTGRKAILYVSQNFVNERLVNASSFIKDREMWIARYSEYKPYVRLLYWQLTPRGRVQGIHGEVDINVYNGTREQFREYLSASQAP